MHREPKRRIQQLDLEELNISQFSTEIRKEIPMGSKGISTLLIPDAIYQDFLLKSLPYKSKTKYFSYLLSRYRIPLKTFAVDPAGLKKHYQDKYLNLKKVNFRPENRDWCELGAMSIASGRSRCLLFVLLLLMDIAGWGSVMKKLGIVMNFPYANDLKWELQGTFGLSYDEEFCIRGYRPKRE